ncbi:methionine/alanine import family NSS transporter small subunit [Candidatus Palauibacter sp.]|nr:methionine/alanine import family NSS transporter small subunit [Acidimicrobiia bacterium]
MTTTTVIMMIVILGFVWGGLAILASVAWRKEGAKRGGEG